MEGGRGGGRELRCRPASNLRLVRPLVALVDGWWLGGSASKQQGEGGREEEGMTQVPALLRMCTLSEEEEKNLHFSSHGKRFDPVTQWTLTDPMVRSGIR